MVIEIPQNIYKMLCKVKSLMPNLNLIYIFFESEFLNIRLNS